MKELFIIVRHVHVEVNHKVVTEYYEHIIKDPEEFIKWHLNRFDATRFTVYQSCVDEITSMLRHQTPHIVYQIEKIFTIL